MVGTVSIIVEPYRRIRDLIWTAAYGSYEALKNGTSTQLGSRIVDKSSDEQMKILRDEGILAAIDVLYGKDIAQFYLDAIDSSADGAVVIDSRPILTVPFGPDEDLIEYTTQKLGPDKVHIHPASRPQLCSKGLCQVSKKDKESLAVFLTEHGKHADFYLFDHDYDDDKRGITHYITNTYGKFFTQSAKVVRNSNQLASFEEGTAKTTSLEFVLNPEEE